MRITPVKGTMEFFKQSRDDLIRWITHENPRNKEINRNFSSDTCIARFTRAARSTDSGQWRRGQEDGAERERGE